jgi:hypothetical protein
VVGPVVFLVLSSFAFDYGTRTVDVERVVPALPPECHSIIDRFLSGPCPVLPSPPDQLTVNEYLP